MLDALLDDFQRGDRRALSRLLSLAARGELGESFLEKLKPPLQPSRVVALTGAAGVGKSTLAGRLIEYLRKQNQKVGVLASDPQSPLSGGALLGDRFRMPSGPDEGIFIRSLAAASGQGAIAKNLPTMIGILESFGFSNILVETVGAGQSDTAVRDVADVVVLLLQPESGDEIQGEKAGLLEVADIIAIHKADLPGVERAEAELRHGLEVAMHRNVPILRVSGKTGVGIEQLWKAISERPLRRSGPRRAGEPGRSVSPREIRSGFCSNSRRVDGRQSTNRRSAGPAVEHIGIGKKVARRFAADCAAERRATLALRPGRGENEGVVNFSLLVFADPDAELPEFLIQDVVLVVLRFHPIPEDLGGHAFFARGDVFSHLFVFVTVLFYALSRVMAIEDVVHFALFRHVGRVIASGLEELGIDGQEGKLGLGARLIRQVDKGLLFLG